MTDYSKFFIGETEPNKRMEMEWTEHPTNIEIKKNMPHRDEDFLERRAKALNFVLDSFELRELIEDIVNQMYEQLRNQNWWIAQYLKMEHMWYDEDATVMEIAEKLYDEAICEQSEIFDTSFQHMLRCIETPKHRTEIKDIDTSELKTPDDLYHFVIFKDWRTRLR